MTTSRTRRLERTRKRRAAGLRRWHRWKANDRAGIAVARVHYNGVALGKLIVSGWLPAHHAVYTDEEIGRAISDLIRHGNLPRR
jgi:hypothetical protein